MNAYWYVLANFPNLFIYTVIRYRATVKLNSYVTGGIRVAGRVCDNTRSGHLHLFRIFIVFDPLFNHKGRAPLKKGRLTRCQQVPTFYWMHLGWDFYITIYQARCAAN